MRGSAAPFAGSFINSRRIPLITIQSLALSYIVPSRIGDFSEKNVGRLSKLS